MRCNVPWMTSRRREFDLESEAVLSILAIVRSGQIDLVTSTALTIETERNPLTARRDYAVSALELARFRVVVDDGVARRASEFVNGGIHPLDALHLACAEEAEADYFCACDDRFLKRAKSIGNLKTLPVTPLELIEELDL